MLRAVSLVLPCSVRVRGWRVCCPLTALFTGPQMEAEREEEARKLEIKKEEARKLMEEVARTNAEVLKWREEEAKAAIEEDRKIAA